MTPETLVWLMLLSFGIVAGLVVGFAIHEIKQFILKNKLKKMVEKQKPQVFSDGKVKRNLKEEIAKCKVKPKQTLFKSLKTKKE